MKKIKLLLESPYDNWLNINETEEDQFIDNIRNINFILNSKEE